VGNAEERRLLGCPRRNREVDINIYLKEVGCGGMDWVEVAWIGRGGGHL
jgi:hypothetical protein